MYVRTKRLANNSNVFIVIYLIILLQCFQHKGFKNISCIFTGNNLQLNGNDECQDVPNLKNLMILYKMINSHHLEYQPTIIVPISSTCILYTIRNCCRKVVHTIHSLQYRHYCIKQFDRDCVSTTIHDLSSLLLCSVDIYR